MGYEQSKVQVMTWSFLINRRWTSELEFGRVQVKRDLGPEHHFLAWTAYHERQQFLRLWLEFDFEFLGSRQLVVFQVQVVDVEGDLFNIGIP